MAYKDIYTTLGFDYLWELDDDGTDSLDSADSDGGTPPDYVASIVPEAAGSYNCGDFNGSDDYLDIPGQSDINTTNTYQKTISLWVKLDDLESSGDGAPLWKEGGNISGCPIYVYNSQIYFNVYEAYGGDNDYVVTGTLSTGTLYHVVVTMDTTAGELKMYVNGALVDTVTGGLAIGGYLLYHTADLSIGGVQGSVKNHNADAMSAYCECRIADLAYKAESTVLTLAQIQSIYDAGVGSSNDVGLFFGKGCF